MTDPDFPVIGYRSWRTNEVGRLWSLFQPCVWEQSNHAVCLRNDDPHPGKSAPVQDCGCGLYAWHEFEEAVRQYGHGLYLTGLVRGWGRLQVHQDGWRAEYADVLAIIERGESHREKAKAIAAIYEVPLLHEEALPFAAFEFGRFVPAELIPQNDPILARTRKVPIPNCDPEDRINLGLPRMWLAVVWSRISGWFMRRLFKP